MNCTSCGAQINAGERYCSTCGAPAPVETTYAPAATVETTYVPAAPALSSTPILVFGILALAFACTFYFSFLGIIFGAIAGKKVSAFVAQGGELAGKAKVGKILGKIGLIIGIVMTAICVLVVFIAMIAALSM